MLLFFKSIILIRPIILLWSRFLINWQLINNLVLIFSQISRQKKITSRLILISHAILLCRITSNIKKKNSFIRARCLLYIFSRIFHYPANRIVDMTIHCAISWRIHVESLCAFEIRWATITCPGGNMKSRQTTAFIIDWRALKRTVFIVNY